MKKRDLITKTNAVRSATKAALQAVYDDLNQGQRKKLLRNPAILAMFERYGVKIEE